MELRDLVDRFEESADLIWLCPIIKRLCDHQCYSYKQKTIAFLYKDKTDSHSSKIWSSIFKDRKNILKWGRHITNPILISRYRIYPEHCDLLDSIENLGGE